MIQDFTGCKAIIRVSEGKGEPVETGILEHDRVHNTVIVSSLPFVGQEPDRVMLMILHEGVMFEMQGRVRKQGRPGYLEIAIFRQKKKVDRATKRFLVNFPALIETVSSGGVHRDIDEPVTVLNISTSGILVRTRPQMLDVSDTFQIKIWMGEEETVINSCVVRVHYTAASHSEYGCQFISLQP